MALYMGALGDSVGRVQSRFMHMGDLELVVVLGGSCSGLLGILLKYCKAAALRRKPTEACLCVAALQATDDDRGESCSRAGGLLAEAAAAAPARRQVAAAAGSLNEGQQPVQQ